MIDVSPDFLAYLEEESARSLDGTLLDDVESLIRSYNGEPYGDEEDGRSQVVSRDVAETIDWMAPSIGRVLFSSDRICELEADDPAFAEQAEQATEKLHDDMRRRKFPLVRDFIKAGLLERIGVIKTCVERRRVREEFIVPAQLIPDDAISAEETGEYDEFGNELYSVAVIVEKDPEIRDYNVPLEEFRFSPDARDLDSAANLEHVVEKSLSDLVQMGYDDVEGLSGEAPEYDSNFRDLNGRTDWGFTDRSGAMRKVWLREQYVFFDLDGDGIAERLKVHRVGTTVLSVEPIDYQPFEYWTPFPMPGRLVGHSLADKVEDIQRKATIIERNALDSIYSQVAPGHYLDEAFITENTIDDLLTIRPNRIIRSRGGVPIPEQKSDVSGICFNALEQLRNQRERRTGISNLHMGLDGDTLNDTATGAALTHHAGQLIQEALAREVAEALGRWFLRKYQLMRRYSAPFKLRVDGEYIDVDPSQWPEIVDLKVRVGLGSGRKDERLEYRREIAQTHVALRDYGSPLVNDEVVYKNLSGLARDMGFNPNECYVDPSQMEPQGEKPDPEMEKVQAEAQMQAAKIQGEQQLANMRLQIQQRENDLRIQLAAEKQRADQELAAAKADFEARLAEAKLAREIDMAERKFAAERQMEANLPDNRPGGDLSK